ncbi:hypothetical protein [Streptomyces phaeochromogenes]|uniref:hypothetical protein n=1 Tax=Streptomyces phaeochromogenes TaxID=1923 RepID=UPI003F4D6934
MTHRPASLPPPPRCHRHLVDAMKGALAAEYGTDAVPTRDLRDFRAVRPLGGRHTHFRIRPEDL